MPEDEESVLSKETEEDVEPSPKLPRLEELHRQQLDFQRREENETFDRPRQYLHVGDYNTNLILSELIKFNDQFKKLVDGASNLNESFLRSLTPSLDKYNGNQQLLNLLKFKIMNTLVEFDREHSGQSIANSSSAALQFNQNHQHYRPL